MIHSTRGEPEGVVNNPYIITQFEQLRPRTRHDGNISRIAEGQVNNPCRITQFERLRSE